MALLFLTINRYLFRPQISDVIDMAKFFKYKNAEQLQADAERLGVSIPISDEFSPLAQSAIVADRRVGNRIVIQPMEGCDGKLDGTPDELTYRRYRRFGAGGAKLIWGEATAVTLESQANPRQLQINRKNVGDFARMLDQCRAAHRESVGNDADLLVGLQLTHSGRFAFRRPILAVHCPVLDPSTIVDRASGRTAEEPYPLIADEELAELSDAFVTAAGLAYRAGFDFVDVKQCHRYLLSELLAAKTRPGRFGGSLENRTAFARGVIARIRAEFPDKIVATRLNCYDGIAYREGPNKTGEPRDFTPPYRTGFGTAEDDPSVEDLTEPLEYIGILHEAGVGLLNVTLGCPYFNPHVTRPAEYPPADGYDAPEHPLLGVGRHFRITAAVQAAYPKLAVVGTGYSYLQDYVFHAGSANVAAGNTTFVGIGRAALAYPDAPKDILEKGTLDRKSICRTFSYCTNLMRNKHHPTGQYPTGCPPFDKEVYKPIWQEAQAAAQEEDG